MGKLHIPIRDTISGPWLLGQEALEELDNVISLASNVVEAAHEKFKESSSNRLLSSNKTIEVKIAQKKKGKFITDQTIKSILIDKNITDFKPESLKIYVGYKLSGIEFEINYTSGAEGNLKYNINCLDEDLENGLNYEFEKWLTKHKPSKIYQLLASVYSTVMILGGLVLFIAWINTLQSTDYQTSPKKQSHQLLDSGVTQSNLDKAVELLLKLKSEYNDENFRSESFVDHNALNVAILITVVYVIFSFFPRSVIGIGKNKVWLAFYKKYQYVFIPFLISSIFLPKIINWINNLF